MQSIKRLLGDTKNAILAAGALAGAVVAVYSAGNTIQSIWDGSSAKPVPNNANIKEAKVEPGVLLEQYEYINQPGATGSASDGSRPQAAGYEPAADTTPAHTRAAIVIAAAVSDGAGTSATSSTTSTTTGSGENLGSGNQQGGTAKEETPEEKEAKKKAGEAKEKEEIKLKEETKAEEQAKETKAKEVKTKEEAKAAKETKAREAAKLKAEAKVVEEEKKEKEEHERKETKGSPTHDSESAGHNGQDDEHEYPTYVLSPSPTSFHREGDARVLIGTGARTNEVNAVLSKVKAILDADNADASTGNGVLNDAVFDDAGGNSAELNDTGPNNAELHNTRLNNTGLNNGLNEGGLSEGGPTTLSETSAGDTTRAPALPLHCGPKCALRPAIDQAIYDSYSNLAQAAKTIAADFAESRVRVFEHKPRPVGVTVDYTLDLIGYAKRRLALEWTLYSKSTGLPLPRTWWHNVIVKQIEPSGPTTHIASNFWAPIPPASGDYYFKLRVFASETEESAHAVTAEFH